VVLGYFEDGTDLVTLAMNGGARASPPGGSISKRTRTRPSIWSTGDGWCAGMPRPGTII
jgi:hypothetical protein